MRPSPEPVLAASIPKTFLPALVLSLALSGCGSSAPDVAPPMPPVIETLVAGLADAACDWQARCCSPVELEQGGGFPTKDECVSHATLELKKAAASLRFAMAEDLITLDEAAAKDCVAQQRTQVCNAAGNFVPSALDFTRWLQACLPAFDGGVIAGGRCEHPSECIKGTHCATVAPVAPVGPTTSGDGGPTSSGSDTICFADQQRGEACQTDDDCDHARQDYCRLPDRHCAARVTEGGKCGYVLTADQFGFLTQIPSPACTAGHFCDANGACRKLPHDGDECLPFSDISMSCDPDPALDLTCVRADFNSPVGVCEPAGKSGDPCGTSGLPPCKGGLSCNQGGERGLGVCGPPPKTGEPCSRDSACESPARCLSSTNVCTKPGDKAAGESCADNTDCASLSCSQPSQRVCTNRQAGPVTCSGSGVNSGTIGGFFPVDGGPIILDASFDRSGPGFTDAPGSTDAPGPDAPPSPVDANVSDAVADAGTGS